MKAERKWVLLRLCFTTLFLFAVWLLFTAGIGWFSLVSGFLGSLMIAALTYGIFIPYHQANIHFFLPNPFALVAYLFVLVFLIYQSSFKMLIAVITGKTNPRIVHFRTHLRSDLSRMTLANSITLTPGTITLDLNDDHLTIHWLFSTTTHAKAAGESVKGRIERIIAKVWL
ncbi:multisubunit Na+/H+ antiporter, MnhE subunit [Sphaerochaeta pleomorpha str. Grapes]|uniref:Multisubunit Na+/H+ antiporter, MnhE subunit n=1 Tax=Sphaerochaeta pleomorpha (strain ATCC BAA-1885 / DSM 22778 / Grapes) TaxID=158190 RepID=G8QTU5_SPHPG|nr:Na+/H+ antiporter subunit E [Sphaerochaeta pleomorpha]AEV29121.1 multisubunit Na+/H+ antiporter, MnhE subunit [Sphaerochaeta pleomorpha str. Grapes]